jgi:hypothetical protein
LFIAGLEPPLLPRASPQAWISFHSILGRLIAADIVDDHGLWDSAIQAIEDVLDTGSENPTPAWEVIAAAELIRFGSRRLFEASSEEKHPGINLESWNTWKVALRRLEVSLMGDAIRDDLLYQARRSVTAAIQEMEDAELSTSTDVGVFLAL